MTMKKHLSYFWAFLFVLTGWQAQGQDDLVSRIDLLEKGVDLEEARQLARFFAAHSEQRPDQWLPDYYAAWAQFKVAYGYRMTGANQKLEAALDTAQIFIDRALSKGGDTLELRVMQGIIFQGRIWPDPINRGARYSSQSITVLKSVLAEDPQHPRAPLALGRLLYHLPVFMGGGAEAARPWLEMAQQNFAQQAVPSSLHPQWGAGETDQLLAKLEQ